MNKLLIAMLGLALAGTAGAKLPASTPEALAKAEEAKQKTAWSDKVAAYQLCKAQDRVAAAYKQKKGGQPTAASAAVAAPASPALPADAAAPAAAPAVAAAPAGAAAAPVVGAAAPVVAAAPAAIPPCTDPGPFAAAASAAAAKVGVADSLPVPAAGKPLTPAEEKK
ncbi:MAG: hypothetical protein ABWY05_02015 [Noviherbaspirillum sp.]